MTKDKSAAKSSEKSYTLVIVASFVIAVLMPFVRALANDADVAVYASAAAAPAPANAGLPGDGSDQLSLVIVGGFLLGLGSLLRRVV